MTYNEQIEQVADHTAEQVLAAVAMYEAGDLTAEALAGIVAAFVAAGNSAAAVLGDLSLAAVLSVELGRAVAPLGVTRPADDPARLTKAARTLLGLSGASLARWERLARSEPLEAAARSYSEGIRRSRHVTGWTRNLSANACQLCQWWSRDGRVWPADHVMPTHKGCTCSPQPTTR